MPFYRKVVQAFALAAALAVVAFAAVPAFSQDAQQGGGWEQGRGRMGQMGRGITGTVTQVAGDHFIIKDETGETYTVHFSANTRVLKQTPRPARNQAQSQGNDNQPPAGETRGGGNGGRDGWGGERRNPPTPIQASDIKVGDVILSAGDIDDNAKSVGAVMIMQLDPDSVKEMREMRANFGKTWLMGRVTAINETKVTLESTVDNASHAFTADENTEFRKRRDPITLGDIQVGDTVRVTGAVKSGVFVAANVAVMGGRPNGGQGGAQNGPAPRQ
jgi:hypothetical protein